MSYDPTDIKAQQRAAETERERIRIAQQTEADDFKWLLSTERGRKMVWNWLADCKVFSTPFNVSAAIANFNMGQHNFGVRMFTAVMTHAPEQFPVMQAEAKKREKSEQ